MPFVSRNSSGRKGPSWEAPIPVYELAAIDYSLKVN